jgi:hypothetical protein
MTDRLKYFVRLFFSRGLKKYTVGGPNGEMQRVRQYLSDCGCGAGSIFLMAFIIIYLSLLIFDPVSFRHSIFFRHSVPFRGGLLPFLGFSLLSAAIGKMAGIFFYRLRAILLLTSIHYKK